MPLGRSRRRSEGINYWPGFVDALSTLLLSIIMILSIFVLGQFFLSQEVTGKDEALNRLNAQIAELSQLLALERTTGRNAQEQLSVLNSSLDQANADKNIAQAKAEERRAMAVALEQEMKAKAEEARANVIQAEAEVPKAMAEAFRSGNLGIMDYYRMKNIQADTSMRENIAKPETTFGNEPLSK